MTTFTLVAHGCKSYDYNADTGSYQQTLTGLVGVDLQAGDLVALAVTWPDSTRTVTSVTAGGEAAASTAAALAWSGSNKRQQTFWVQIASAHSAPSVSSVLSGTADAYSVAFEVWRPSEAGTFSLGARATAVGGYGTTPISTAAFNIAGAAVVTLWGGHNYYNESYPPNFGSDTLDGRTNSNGHTYNNAWWGHRVTSGPVSNATATTDLPATSFDSYLGLQAVVFEFTPSGGGTTAVSSDLDLAYGVVAAVQADRALSYGVVAAVQVDRALSYGVVAAVQVDLALNYGVVAAVHADLALSYGVAGTVASDITLAYGVRVAAQADIGLSYAVVAPVQADFAVAYGVVGRVQADLSLGYGVIAAVQEDLTLSYGVIAAVQEDLTLSYGVVTAVQEDLTLSYGVVTAVQEDLTLAYAVQSASHVTSDLALGYGVAGRVAADFACNYAVQQPAQVDLALSYGVAATAQTDLALSYGVVGHAQIDLSITYGAVAPVQADLALNFGVTSRVQSDRAIGYAVSARVTSDLPMTFVVADSGTGASASQVWNHHLVDGRSAEDVLLETNRYVMDLARIHGLVLGEPLRVESSRRAAGAIEQSIGESGGAVTIERTA